MRTPADLEAKNPSQVALAIFLRLFDICVFTVIDSDVKVAYVGRRGVIRLK